MTASWKTSVSGIIAALVVVAQAVQTHLQEGQADWSLAIAAVIGCVGMLMARDSNVTSEQQGISKVSKSKIISLIPLLFCTLFFVGCSTATSTPDLINDAKEENSGWTDADNRDIRIVIHSGATLNNSTIELWIETTSGNARAGKGADSANATGDTNQTPENTTTTDVSLPNPITGG